MYSLMPSLPRQVMSFANKLTFTPQFVERLKQNKEHAVYLDHKAYANHPWNGASDLDLTHNDCIDHQVVIIQFHDGSIVSLNISVNAPIYTRSWTVRGVNGLCVCDLTTDLGQIWQVPSAVEEQVDLQSGEQNLTTYGTHFTLNMMKRVVNCLETSQLDEFPVKVDAVINSTQLCFDIEQSRQQNKLVNCAPAFVLE